MRCSVEDCPQRAVLRPDLHARDVDYGSKWSATWPEKSAGFRGKPLVAGNLCFYHAKKLEGLFNLKTEYFRELRSKGL